VIEFPGLPPTLRSVSDANLDDIVQRLMTRTSHQVFNQRVAAEITIMRRIIAEQARRIADLSTNKETR